MILSLTGEKYLFHYRGLKTRALYLKSEQGLKISLRLLVKYDGGCTCLRVSLLTKLITSESHSGFPQLLCNVMSTQAFPRTQSFSLFMISKHWDASIQNAKAIGKLQLNTAQTELRKKREFISTCHFNWHFLTLD